MAFSQGLVSGTDIPVEHLDYDYIGKCESVSEVESLLKILRSNQEGHYPDLIKFTEEKLQKLNPKSKLLIKTKEAQRLRDLPSGDSRGIMADLENWEEQISTEETHLQDTPSDAPANGDVNELPPIRKAGPITKDPPSKSKSSGSKSSGDKRLESGDYQGWNKYDVEKECEKVDENTATERKEERGKGLSMEASLSEKELQMSAVEKQKLALREKEKGNEAFRAGDYEEALTYYSRSILLDHSAPSCNNRAITYIKLQRYQEALQDCASVLQLEPTNTKALLRRGTALLGVKDWRGAEKAMQQLLKVEPKNKKAQEVLNKALEESAKSAKPETKKGRRVQIEEVDEEETVTSDPTTPSSEPVTSSADASKAAPMPLDVSMAVPMPQDVVECKEKGNELFRKGQYGEAVSHYTKAVQRLEKAGDGHEVSMSTLLNNRAACHLKNGNSQACVADCTQSLQLVPVNIKALVRRAQAYEHTEKYRLAYMDNHLALSLDRSMETVYATNSRISKQLLQQDGSKWRDKLPPHPDQQRVAQALSVTGSSTAQPASVVMAPTSATTPPTTAGATPTVPPTPASATPTTQPTKAATSPSKAATPSTHSITTSSAADFEPKVTTQAATPISTTSTTTSPHPVPPEPSNVEKFEKAKAKGNEHVKKGRYVEALNCYSACIAACPDRVVGYTNRALCHLKLNSPTSAEKDCTKCLELEPNNIKALYRRALARKAMAKYSDSMKDLKQLLELDSENSVAKGEYATVKSLWEKQLRQLQDKSQKQKGKKLKKTSSPGHKAKGGSKEKEKSIQQQELEQLLAETKNKMNELKRDPLAFSENSSEYLNASKTTYYKPQTVEQKGGAARRRKVVVEEETSEDQSPVTATKEKVAKKSGDQPQERRGGDQPLSAKPEGERREDQPMSQEGGERGTQEKEGASSRDEPSGPGEEVENKTAGNAQLSSPYEFARRWNSIPRGGDTSEYAALLEQIPPKKLPEIITNKLEGAMLTKIITAISSEFLPQKRCQLSLEILENLSKVPRFQTIAMFLSKQDKAELSGALDCLEKWDGSSKSTIGSLRKLYGVNM